MNYENEQKVRLIINDLLSHLGYSKDDIEVEPTIEIYAGGKRKKGRPDYVVSVDGQKKFIIEAKSSRVNISNKRIIGQAQSYANSLNTEHFAISNGKQFAFYSTRDSQRPLWEFNISSKDSIAKRLGRNKYQPKKAPGFWEMLEEEDFHKATEIAAQKATRYILVAAKKKFGDFISSR